MHPLLDLLVSAFHRPATRSYRWTQWASWALIVLSLLLFASELLWPALWQEPSWLRMVDRVILGFFAAELLLRVLTWVPPQLDFYQLSPAQRLRLHITARLDYLLQPLNMVDLFAVLSLHPALRSLRALRLLRLLRSARLFEFNNPFRALTRALHDNRHLFYFGQSFLGLTIVVGGLTLYLAEATVNPGLRTPADGMWWALVTISTVGFGDITPVTLVGRIVGAVLMIASMFTLAFFAGTVGTTLIGAVINLRQEQFRMGGHVGHTIVIGYDSGSAMLLHLLLDQLPDEREELVIISDRERPPEVPPRYSWVRGDPTKESELRKVRLEHASKVVVVASREESPQRADALTLMELFTLRSYVAHHLTLKRRADSLYVVAEILDTENVHHARAAGADEVIESTRLGFSMMAHALAAPGTASIMSSVVAAESQTLFVDAWTPPPGSQPSTFLEWRLLVRKHTGALVIGIRTDEGDRVNPPDPTPVPPGTRLIYLADDDVLAPPTDSPT